LTFEAYGEVPPMVGKMVLVDVVVSVNRKEAFVTNYE
jgi:hypothetical protein